MGSHEVDRKLIFWGTPLFSVPSLEALLERAWIRVVVTRIDKPQGRGRCNIRAPAVKTAAQSCGIPVLAPEKFDDQFLSDLKQFLPATFVVVAYGKIIPSSILRLSALTALNVHPSLLPDLRGPSPIQTALIKGYTETGCTLMELDSEMDHGPIIAQKTLLITADDTYESLSTKLSKISAKLLIEFIPQYLTGRLRGIPQDHSRATYCKLIKSPDGKLDLILSAQMLYNRIRALNPWPGTYILWGTRRLKIIHAVPYYTAIRHVNRSPAGRLLIRCGPEHSHEALEVTTVQLEGKRVMSSQEFLHGHSEILRS